MQLNKISKEAIFFIVVIIFSLCGYLYNKYYYRNIENNPRYTIGVINEKLVGKNGATYISSFLYNNKMFKARFTGLGLGYQTGDTVVIKFQQNKPDVHSVLLNYRVLPKLRSASLPGDGWKEIPEEYISIIK